MTHRKIERSDVLNFFEYEKVRAEMRARIIELKRIRRVTVGRHLSFVFENRDTVLYPAPHEHSASLFTEITEKEEIQPVLDRFMGIDLGPTVWMQVGKEFAVPGAFEPGHSDEDKGKLSAVHFVRFAFSPEVARAFAGSPVSLVVDHPAERGRVELSPETKAQLLLDLAA